MIVVDNFIEDKRLLSKVNQDPFFNTEGPHWWGNWWENEFINLRQEVLTHLFAKSKRFVSTDVAGFKHWVSECKEGIQVEPSFDKDTECLKETGNFQYPTIGSIYFHDPKVDKIEGGLLQVWDEQDKNSSYELIKPKYNRLLIFDVSKLYGFQKITKGSFNYLNVSLWKNPVWRFENFAK